MLDIHVLSYTIRVYWKRNDKLEVGEHERAYLKGENDNILNCF